MSRLSEGVKRWRQATKDRIVESLGGACAICGYKRSFSALDCHHLDPSEKDFGLGAILSRPLSWEKIVPELRKCILLCKNCHAEVHDGLVTIPENAVRFDEEFSDYKEQNRMDLMDQCPICGKLKRKHQYTCSRSCSGKRSWVVDWESVDLPTLLETNGIQQIADSLGISYPAVKKRMNKLGLVTMASSSIG